MERFRKSLIQHGLHNDRVYMMKVDSEDCPDVIGYAEKLAKANDYSKIFAKVPKCCRQFFLQEGFIEEAAVPALFNEQETGYFFSKFTSPWRRRERAPETVSSVLEVAENKSDQDTPDQELHPRFSWRIMHKDDVHTMAQLYKQVFATYPFPIIDPDYLSETMDQNVIYHGIFDGEKLVAISSAEIDFAGKHVEMTDFATLPDYRGQGLASYLLDKMEQDVSSSGIRTAYTIARAYSYGMNITFAKHSYEYSGTLINNTQISGNLESMNVWHKPLGLQERMIWKS